MAEVLIDTNLVLLFVVGEANPGAISTHRRLGAFDATDLALLKNRLARYSGHVTLPNILTETSNLLRIGKDPRSAEPAKLLVRYAQTARELYVPSHDVGSRDEFFKFGLTDTAIASLFHEGISVITVDFDFYGFLTYLGMDAINLRHDRSPSQ
ncbi:hypothetical protein P1J78_06545 [Psychromarinibacter sp. C21-152]|uniref:PIN domain-containing protein n=1 Tax=Psychromarinibacter sediminicola TaxID=3033385 RepID=A0AAE3T7N0_9RHOB|nr:hypothetical protein [Psychromarinibacter sediminicola]MDF0600382.1 hypothetical protein [Psychromarinibacter sediminicola]